MAEKNSQNYVTLTHRVGNTNYKVRVHFSETGEETITESGGGLQELQTALLPYCDNWTLRESPSTIDFE